MCDVLYTYMIVYTNTTHESTSKTNSTVLFSEGESRGICVFQFALGDLTDDVSCAVESAKTK